MICGGGSVTLRCNLSLFSDLSLYSVHHHMWWWWCGVTDRKAPGQRHMVGDNFLIPGHVLHRARRVGNSG